MRTTCIACGPIPVLILTNAAAATSKGFEVELSALATENLTITAGVGYSDATYDKFEGVTDNRTRAIVDASGNDIPVAPDWTLNVAVQHRAQLGAGTVRTRLDYSFIDSRYSVTGVINDSDFALPSQSMVNARIGYRPQSDNWGISLWGRSLTDDDPLVYAAYRTAFGSGGTWACTSSRERTA